MSKQPQHLRSSDPISYFVLNLAKTKIRDHFWSIFFRYEKKFAMIKLMTCLTSG